MISYTRTHLVVLLCTVLQSSLTYGYKACTSFCAKCVMGDCVDCKSGYSGTKCNLPCAVHCKGGLCLDQTCSFDCAVGWYGLYCDRRCAHCPNGCYRLIDTCRESKKDKDNDEDNAYDYRPTNASEMVIIAFAAIGCVAIVVIGVFIWRRRRRRRREESNEDNVGGDHRTAPSSREYHSPFAEPSAPMMDNRDYAEPQSPPTAPPPPATSFLPPAPMEVPPPAYSSLFPGSDNKTLNPS